MAGLRTGLALRWLTASALGLTRCMAASHAPSGGAGPNLPPWLPRTRCSTLRVTGEATLEARAERAAALCSPEPGILRDLRSATASTMPAAAHMLSGPVQGRLLALLVRLARARRVLEVGTFTGYSAVWMARALPPGGELVTCERDPASADMARDFFRRAGFAPAPVEGLGGEGNGEGTSLHVDAAGRAIRLCMGLADDTIAALGRLAPRAATAASGLPVAGAVADAAGERAAADEEAFGLVFIDGDKKRCADYVRSLGRLGLVKTGTLFLIDNVLFRGAVLQCAPSAPSSTVPSAAEAAHTRGAAPQRQAAAEEADVGKGPVTCCSSPGFPRLVRADSDDKPPLAPPGSRTAKLAEAMHCFNGWLARDGRFEQVLMPLRDGLTVARWLPPDLTRFGPALKPGSQSVALAGGAVACRDTGAETAAGTGSDTRLAEEAWAADEVDLERALTEYAAAHSTGFVGLASSSAAERVLAYIVVLLCRLRAPSTAVVEHQAIARAMAIAVPACALVPMAHGGLGDEMVDLVVVPARQCDVRLRAMRERGVLSPTSLVVVTDVLALPQSVPGGGDGAAFSGGAPAVGQCALPLVVREWAEERLVLPVVGGICVAWRHALFA